MSLTHFNMCISKWLFEYLGSEMILRRMGEVPGMVLKGKCPVGASTTSQGDRHRSTLSLVMDQGPAAHLISWQADLRCATHLWCAPPLYTDSSSASPCSPSVCSFLIKGVGWTALAFVFSGQAWMLPQTACFGQATGPCEPRRSLWVFRLEFAATGVSQ